jgi:hypothetical protein
VKTLEDPLLRQDSSVGIATWQQDGRRRNFIPLPSPGRDKVQLSFPKSPERFWGRTQPALFSRGSNDECKNEWTCTSFPLHAFVAWTATFLCAYLIFKAFFLQRELRWVMRKLASFQVTPVATPVLRHIYLHDIEDSIYEKSANFC